jgi:hypothetical protein
LAWDQAKSQALTAAKDAVSSSVLDKSADFEELFDKAKQSAMRVYADAGLNNGVIPEDVIRDGRDKGYITYDKDTDSLSFAFDKGPAFVHWASAVRLSDIEQVVETGLN